MRISPNSYLPLFVGDYLADTMHYTCEEHGAYLLALMHQWCTGKFLPKELQNVLRLSDHKFTKIFGVISEKFEVDEDGKCYSHRLELERARVLEIQGKRAQAGKKGAQKRWADGDSKRHRQTHTFANSKTMAPIPTPIPSKELPIIKGSAITAEGGNGHYRWEGQKVRLNENDYEKLRSEYNKIPDFDAALSYADDVCVEEKKNGKWWPRMLSILNYQHQQASKPAKPNPTIVSAI